MKLTGMMLALGVLGLAACDGSERADRTGSSLSETTEPTALSPRLRVMTSTFDHAETMRRLYEALDRRDLTVFATIDHAAGAQSVGSTLPPTTVVIFGSPSIGTPLMLAEPRMAAELPFRAAVYQTAEGNVEVAVTSSASLLRSYPELQAEFQRLEQVRGNLEALLIETTGTER